MKKILLSLLILCTVAQGQTKDEKPDYGQIEKNTKDKSSPFYYETLKKRFDAADSTMNTQECRHLYYGYSFTDAYKPYGTKDAKKKLNEALQKDEEITDYEAFITLCNAAHAEFPFDISVLQYRRYFYRKLGNTARAEEDNVRVGLILEAILSTGSGQEANNAIYVIAITNEYQILSVLGFEFGGKQSLIDSNDYLTVAKNEYNIEGLYFDVSRSLMTFKE